MSYSRDWSKAQICRPRDNLISHEHLKKETRRFIPSYESDKGPVPMKDLISHEYARIWAREHAEFDTKLIIASKPKRIKNDYSKYVKRRSAKK